MNDLARRASRKDFLELIVPHLERTGIVPAGFIGNRARFLDRLYNVTSDQSLSPWHRQSRMQDEFAVENLDFRLVTGASVSAFGTFSMLRDALCGGHTHARGSSTANACATCMRDVHDQVFTVQDLLAAYRQPSNHVPVLPHDKCHAMNGDSGEWCRCLWILLPRKAPGVDPKFLAWMQAELAKHKANALARGDPQD